MLGFSGSMPLDLTPYLKTMMSHSHDHPHGWGIATFYGNSVNLEKEPKMAWLSDYLNSKLSFGVEASNLIAHIRYATRGSMQYENCHPFVLRDSSNRAWTLAHNGTIFTQCFLDDFKGVQKGATDSERVLFYLVSEINKALKHKNVLSDVQRFAIVEEVVLSLAENNKLNLLIYDGELLYVHTNMKGSLYLHRMPEGCAFATVPLDNGEWSPVPMMQLLAYKNGRLSIEGTKHRYEYIKDLPSDYSMSWLGL